MAFRQRNVTGFVFDGDGTPVETATIQFKPTKPLGYTDTHVVVDRIFTVETDTDGEFAITLWCDEDSLKAIDYTVMFPAENNGQPDPLHIANISLAYEDGSDKDIGTLIAESTPADEIITEQTLANLIDERIALAGGGGGGGGFTAASTTEVLTGTDNAKGVTPDALAALWEQGADIASAAILSIGEGGYFNITGTTTITDIDFGTDKAGRVAWLKFAGILTLTNGANLILPTGANIVTAAGDTALVVSEGSDVIRVLAYHRASGAPLAGGGGASAPLVLTAPSSSDIPLIVKGAAAQSAHLQEWQNSAGTALVTVSPDGDVTVPNGKSFKTASGSLIGYNNGGGRLDINDGLIGVPVRINGTNLYFYDTAGPELIFRVDARGGLVAGETVMQIWDKDNGQVERVSVGAADSGGSGYKVLRIPN
ncbi:MAG: hypothetical protein ABI539_15165 [Acidobacteriota bacterium]